MSPVSSHICEEFWNILGEKEYCSLAKFDCDVSKYISKDLEEKEGIVSNIIENVYKTKDVMKLDKLNKVVLVQASNNRFDLFDDLGKLLNETKNVKEIFSNLNSKYPNETNFIKKFVPKTLGSGLSFYMKKEDEMNY